MTPKPRREGQRGGMNHTGSQARSSRRGGDSGRYGGPPKKSCVVLLFIIVAIPAIITVATGGLIFGA